MNNRSSAKAIWCSIYLYRYNYIIKNALLDVSAKLPLQWKKARSKAVRGRIRRLSIMSSLTEELIDLIEEGVGDRGTRDAIRRLWKNRNSERLNRRLVILIAVRAVRLIAHLLFVLI